MHNGPTSGPKTKNLNLSKIATNRLKIAARPSCPWKYNPNPHKQTQIELFMLEVGESGTSEAILLEIGKCGKTYYLTSEYLTMTKEWTGTWDKQGTLCLKYDKVEECIKIQCIFLFYYPVCVNQGTFVREPKVEQQQLKPPAPCPSMTIHLMCQDIRWCLRTSSEVMGHHVISHDIMSTWCPNLAHCRVFLAKICHFCILSFWWIKEGFSVEGNPPILNSKYDD